VALGKLVITGAGRPLSIRTTGFGTFSPDGRWLRVLTTSGEDLWEVDRRRRTASIDGFGIDAFSPVGALVAVAGLGGQIRLVDRTSGRERGTLDGDADVLNLAFSPDGRTLAAVSAHRDTDGVQRASVELWDVAARRRLGHEPLLEWPDTHFVRSVEFAPDGNSLVVAGVGPAPLVFDLDVDDWAARAGRLAAGPP
jgi:WD40 repeat protein